MGKKIGDLFYRFLRFLVSLFYHKPESTGTEHISPEPCIFVGNHTQMNGPIVATLYMPEPCYIWCAGEMMHKEEVADYAYRDFWSQKPKWIQWYYHLAAHAITPLAVNIFNHAPTIPVYHDARLVTTFRQTMQRLDEGNSIVIFPEKDEHYNHILYEFQDKFVDVARSYYKHSGRAVEFVPMYIAPKLHQTVFGKPIRFDPENNKADERERICNYLKQEITDMAEALPEHTVIPYRNIPKRDYPKNHTKEAQG